MRNVNLISLPFQFLNNKIYYKDPGIICRVLKACRDKDLQAVEEKPIEKNTEWTPAQLSKIKVKIINADQAIIRTPLQPKAPLTSPVSCYYFWHFLYINLKANLFLKVIGHKWSWL